MHRICVACAVVLVFPMGALADAGGSVTIPVNMNFSFDTGSLSSSGGDIQFTGPTIAVVGSATQSAIDFGTSGNGGSVQLVLYEEVSQNSLAGALAGLGGTLFTDPIIALSYGSSFEVLTNGGNLAKFVILAVNGTSLQIQWYTYGASATGGTPLPQITTILNAGSYQGNGIAQGSLFVVKGSNLSAGGYVQNSFPLPTSINGVSISFWIQSSTTGVYTATNAYLVSLYNQNGVNQLAAIVPSSLTPGVYQVIVTNNSVVSQVMQLEVLPGAPGLITQDSSGSGLVLAQNYVSSSELDINRFTTGTVDGSTISPAHPGQTVIAWLTGLGPISTADNVAAPAYNFAANGTAVQVYVGGMAITPTYAGRAPGLAAIDQVDFVLPADVTTGCVVPFVVEENGVLSQPTFISIAPDAAATSCAQPGLTDTKLQALDNGAVLTFAQASLNLQTGQPATQQNTDGFAAADFVKFTGFELSGAVNLLTQPQAGCTVTPFPLSPLTVTPG